MIILKNKKDCCGCNACVQICPVECIKMEQDAEGFFYPKTDIEKCIDCGKCEKVCPVINQASPRKPLKTYAAKSKDRENLVKSSSGGLFFIMAENIISQGGVVFGARFNKDWDVVHGYTETKEGLALFRGSKYVQSDINSSFVDAERFLKSGRKVLFSGMPCQIAGLRLFLNKEYDNLLSVDLACHGVPSPMVWKKYLNELCVLKKIDINTIANIQFRSKITGWKESSFVIDYKNVGKSFHEKLSRNTYVKGYFNHLYTRPSCHDCPTRNFKSGSDITIADYWGIQTVSPAFFDEKGVGLMFVNTSKGKNMYDVAMSKGVKSMETSYADAVRKNPSIERSFPMTKERDLFFDRFSAGAAGVSVIPIINMLTKEPFSKVLRMRYYVPFHRYMHKLKMFVLGK